MKHLLCFFLLLPLYLFSSNPWQPTEYIWNLGLVLSIDNKKMSAFEDSTIPLEAYKNIQEGDIVWLRSDWFPQFINQIFPFIKHPFILVTSHSDISMPYYFHEDPQFLLNDPRLIHWFTQNYDYMGKHHKISPIPIGIDFHTKLYKEEISPKDQEEELKKILATLEPTSNRLPKVLCDWHLNNSSSWSFNSLVERFGEDRWAIFHFFESSKEVEFIPHFLARKELWKLKGTYAFSISPFGVGLDCHRTWEDLALGCIVIVKTSPLDPLYTGLPVVIVKDWAEVTQENLLLWQKKYGDAFTNPSYREKITTKYWVEKIRFARKKGVLR